MTAKKCTKKRDARAKLLFLLNAVLTGLAAVAVAVVVAKTPYCHVTPIPPQNGHLSTTATFFCPLGVCCEEVSTVKKHTINK